MATEYTHFLRVAIIRKILTQWKVMSRIVQRVSDLISGTLRERIRVIVIRCSKNDERNKIVYNIAWY